MCDTRRVRVLPRARSLEVRPWSVADCCQRAGHGHSLTPTHHFRSGQARTACILWSLTDPALVYSISLTRTPSSLRPEPFSVRCCEPQQYTVRFQLLTVQLAAEGTAVLL